MQPAATVGGIDFERCPMNDTAAADLWLVDLHLQGYAPEATERLLLPNRLVEGLDFLRSITTPASGGENADR